MGRGDCRGAWGTEGAGRPRRLTEQELVRRTRLPETIKAMELHCGVVMELNAWKRIPM